MTNASLRPATPSVIQGATVLLPASAGRGLRPVRADVYLSADFIVGLGQTPVGFDHTTAQYVDGSGLVLAPGLVDLCAQYGDEKSALFEAVAGGITCFLSPGTGRRRLIDRRVAKHGVGYIGGQDGSLDADAIQGDMDTDQARHVWDTVGDFSSGFDCLDDLTRLRDAMVRAYAARIPLLVQPQDSALAGKGVMASGNFAVRLGLPGIPVVAETRAIETVITLMRETGAIVHLSRLSSAEGVAQVRDAKAAGLPITCDVSIHHLHLTDVDIGWFDSRFRFDPPLRSAADRDALRQGLADGTIDAICSDHTPHRAHAKQVPFAEASPGAPAFALLLALTLKWAAEAHVPLAEALSRITSIPAAIAGLRAGRIAVGDVADLVLFDPEDYWQVADADRLGTNTLDSRAASPFAGFELPAPIRESWLAGRQMSELRDSVGYADRLQDR